MSIREMPETALVPLVRDAEAFRDSPLWAALKAIIEQDIARIGRDLSDTKATFDQLKVAQGELTQANRDIMLVDTLLERIAAGRRRNERRADLEVIR